MQSVIIGGQRLIHPYSFDPSYGYSLEQLLSIEPPPAPVDFESFWKARFDRAVAQNPQARLNDTGKTVRCWRVMDLDYDSTDGRTLRGWVLVPVSGTVRRAFVVGHGYGGRDAPDFDLPFPDAALLFPCSRGLGRSASSDLPNDPMQHVVHGIEDRDRYVIGGCVEDLWLAVSATLELFPETAGRLNLLGISFSGGIAMLAAPWDDRVAKVHVNVPTFGHQPLRLELPTVGSGAGAQAYARKHPGEAQSSLAYYDSAIAARFAKIPTHCACARFDPAVTPAGQFAIHNALPFQLRGLYVLTAGHHPYPEQARESAELLRELNGFFAE